MASRKDKEEAKKMELLKGLVIDEVSFFPEIFDKSHENHKNCQVTQACWEAVAFSVSTDSKFPNCTNDFRSKFLLVC